MMKKDRQTAGDREAAPQNGAAAQENAPAVEDTDQARAMDECVQQADRIAQERDEYLNLAQRVQADFDNYRRRNQNVREEAYNEGVRDTLVKFLPVLDNLERALQAQGQEADLREGVLLVNRQFVSLLNAAGVEEIKAEGEPFDPNLHNAVLQEAAPGAQSGSVTAVMLKGYCMQGRVLRHSMVKVAE